MARRDVDLPYLPAELVQVCDDEGIGAELRLAPRTDAVTVRIGLFDANHRPLPGHAPYADASGAFLLDVPVDGDVARFYLPYGAVGHRAPTRCLLVATFRRRRGGICAATLFRDLALPAPRPYDRAGLLAPLVGLVMTVMRADAVIPEAVRHARRRLTEGFSLASSDMAVLRDLMKAPLPTDLPAEVARLAVRFPRETPPIGAFVVDLATEICLADTRPPAARVVALRQLVAAIHPGSTFPAAWRTVEARLGPDPEERLRHLATLGLSKGASPDEIRAAYRSRVREAHPDRFATRSAEIREQATQKTSALNQAWDALRPLVPDDCH